MQQPIETITVKGFKSIQNLENFELRPLNVLIGANGTGKSNFIALFRMLGELVEGRLQTWVRKEQGGADRIVSFGIKETLALDLFIKFGTISQEAKPNAKPSKHNTYRFILEPTIEDQFSFQYEEVDFYDGSEYLSSPERLGSGGYSESKLPAAAKTKKVASFCYNAITSWKVYHFHDTSDTAEVKRWNSLYKSDNTYLQPNASNLAAFLYTLAQQHEDVYQKIRRTVQLALPFFDDFQPVFRESDASEEQIRLHWRQKDSAYAFHPSQLSDGSLRFIGLVTALLQPKPPSTLLIDEPELGLHPYAISLLASLIRSATTRMQVIISTQSVSLVNEFDIEDLVIVEQDNGGSVFKRCDESEFKLWLENYTTGELWEKNILGGRP